MKGCAMRRGCIGMKCLTWSLAGPRSVQPRRKNTTDNISGSRGKVLSACNAARATFR